MEETRTAEWCTQTAVAAARAAAFVASAGGPGLAQARAVELAVRLLGASQGTLRRDDAAGAHTPTPFTLSLDLTDKDEPLQLELLFEAEVDAEVEMAAARLAPVLSEALAAARLESAGGALGPTSAEARRHREWTAIIAHDLRQPVSTLVVQIGMLRRHRTQPRLETLLDQMMRSVRVLDRMIGDLLDSSELDVRGLSVRPVEVDLSELLGAFSARVGPVLTGRRLIVRGGDSHSPVRADPERLEQVLWNLVSNAVKYGKPESPVEVHLRSDAAGSRISVRNEGRGIAQADLARLFRRFERLGRPEDAEQKGLGLGLYIARGLIESHGGRLWAESTPGKETFFHVWLPSAVHVDEVPHAAVARLEAAPG